MQIRRIQIADFGKLHDMELDFSEGFQTITGENGWGKSTMAAFIKAMLYGMEATTRRSLLENERRHYQPWQGGAYGGSMEFTDGGKTYRAERTFGSKEKDDTFALYDLSTGLLSTDYSERLGEELFHVDRGAWERSCYLGQRKLEVLVNDSLHARLSHAEEDAGDIENYERAAASLEERMKFLKKTGNRGEIAKLQEERRQVREQMEAYEIQQEKLWKAQQELLEKRLKEQEEKLQEANVRLAGYEELPMKEQELDRLREQIFRFQAAQEREQTAKQQYMQAQKQEERRKAELEEVRECAQEQKYSDRKWMLTGVTGLIVMLTGMVLMVCCFSDIIFMTALFGILILLGLASTITSFLQLFRNQRSCHPVSYTHLDVYKRQEPGNQSCQQSDEVHPAAYPKPQRLDYRAGRKTERAACTKGGGGSNTSSQSADEVHGDTKGRTEGLDEGWTEPGDFTGLKGSQRSPVLSPSKGAFHCGGLRSVSGIFREISRRLPQSDEAKGSPQQSD